jgi:hypothetical protein
VADDLKCQTVKPLNKERGKSRGNELVESVFHLADETRRLATNNAASSSVAGPLTDAAEAAPQLHAISPSQPVPRL